MPTFVKYLLFQIPEWILLAAALWFLARNTPVNLWPAVLFFLFWVIKDFAIYPYVRRSYENDAKTGSEALVGGKGVVHDPVAPEGYIRIHGELWKARADGERIPRDTVVKVTAARGMTLIVEEERRIQAHGNAQHARR
jgi:membrane protein implicated in regulation of membrane protease activity